MSSISRATPTRRGWSSSSPGAADDGLFARDAKGVPLVFDKTTGAFAASTAPRRRSPRSPASSRYAAAARREPVFQPDGRALSRRRVRARRRRRRDHGVSADQYPPHRRRLAHVAVQERRSTLPIALDRLDRAAATTAIAGRPVSMHAMRGISAHSNGFHTCRLIHVLQILLGTMDVPGWLPLQAALPEVGAAAR